MSRACGEHKTQNARCVLIRVHDRMGDLEVCVGVVRKRWKRSRYHIVVVSNGRTRGYHVPAGVGEQVDEVREIEDVTGHFAGSARLLQEGIRAVPEACPWTILLEADTWIFDDAVLDAYIERLERQRKVWASALWVERYHSLALDVAIVETAFAKRHPGLFAFREPPGPEAWVHNHLRDAGHEPLYIREHMPVHIPSLMRRFHNKYGGRFRTFVRAHMVTHHSEDLPGGLEDKKRIANRVLGEHEFDVADEGDLVRHRDRMRFAESLRAWIPRSAWFRKRRWKNTP